jgi:hypothetical protein
MKIQDLPHHPFLSEVREGMRVIPAQSHQLPSVSDLDPVAIEVGWPLPEPYRRFVMSFGAVYLEVKEEIWPAAAAGSVAPYWQLAKYGFKLFGVAKEVPEFLDVRRALKGFRQRNPDRHDLLPVFQWAGGANFVTCLTGDGVLCEFDLVAGEMESRFETEFDEFVVQRARELKDYMIQMAGIRGLG